MLKICVAENIWQFTREQLGISKELPITSFHLNLEAGCVAEVVIKCLPSKEQAEAIIAHVAKHYELTEKQNADENK